MEGVARERVKEVRMTMKTVPVVKVNTNKWRLRVSRNLSLGGELEVEEDGYINTRSTRVRCDQDFIRLFVQFGSDTRQFDSQDINIKNYTEAATRIINTWPERDKPDAKLLRHFAMTVITLVPYTWLSSEGNLDLRQADLSTLCNIMHWMARNSTSVTPYNILKQYSFCYREILREYEGSRVMDRFLKAIKSGGRKSRRGEPLLSHDANIGTTHSLIKGNVYDEFGDCVGSMGDFPRTSKSRPIIGGSYRDHGGL